MSNSPRCPNCGVALSAEDTAAGLCPKCLLKLGLEEGSLSRSGPPDETARTLVAAPDGLPAQSIGPYRLLEKLGEGGMGIVYLAEQSGPLRRRVALKLIKPGMDGRQVLARFEAERQALALMNHPGIAQVHDAGTDEQGRPYFVMKLVQGVPITDYCDEKRLSVQERLGLLIQVCEAIQHAHQKGIIHRDIKPSNVLVSVQDAAPITKVIDFGVSKALSQKLTERSLFTERGILIGTPEYMSPEQAGTTALDVDTRTDIYSLGVLLYELLVGAVPFDGSQLRAAAFLEMLRIIREEEPPKPTTRISALGESAAEVARRRHTDVSTLARLLRGDLEWIPLKALEKDPSRRYASASELAADLERFLRSEPVSAHPPSIGYQMRKFSRRHKSVVAAGGAILVAVLSVAVASSALFLVTERARTQRVAELVRLHTRAGSSLLESERPLEALPSLAAALRLEENDEESSLHRLRLGTVLAYTPEFRLVGTDDNITAAAFDAIGERAVTAGSELLLWNLASGEPLASVPKEEGTVLLRLSPDGTRFAALVLGEESSSAKLRIRSAVDGRDLVPALAHPEAVADFRFSPDGRRLATVTSTRGVADTRGGLEPQAAGRLWDTHTGELIAELGAVPPQADIAFHPSSQWLATAGVDGGWRIWKSDTGERATSSFEPAQALRWLKITEDGRGVGALGNGAWRVWRVPPGLDAIAPVGSWRRAPLSLHHLMSPDRAWIVSLDRERAYVLDARSGDRLVPRIEANSPIRGAVFSPDSRWLATAAENGDVRVWHVPSFEPVTPTLSHESSPRAIAFDPTGRFLSVCVRASLRVWDLASSEPFDPPSTVPGRIFLLETHRDGSILIAGSSGMSSRSGGVAQGLDPRGGQPTTPRLLHASLIRTASLSPDGEALATGSIDGRARIWATASGEPITDPLQHDLP